MFFSILIPAFKRQYLEECLTSVLNQSFSDFEIVILDDYSPENLLEVVSRFSDKRIRYYKNDKNCGAINVIENWNKCLSYAQGDYVMCIGDDDMLSADCLEKYNNAIQNHPDIDVFHCRSYIINEKSENVSMTPSWPEYETVYDNIWHRIFHYREHFIGDFLFKRTSLIDKGGFYHLPLAWASDDITSYIAMANKGVVHINTPIFYYRRSNVTISSGGNIEYKLKAIKGEEDWYNSFFKSITPQDKQDAVLEKSIKYELPHYLKKKRIATIAYFSGEKSVMSFLIYWYRRRTLTHLGFKELLYSTLLFYKYKKSHRNQFAS